LSSKDAHLELQPPCPETGAAEAAVMICPRRWGAPEVADLWQYRDLAVMLATRDLRVRYKQTALGAAWAVLQPLATMVVMHVCFGQIMGMAQRVGDVAYPIFLFSGLLPWTLFAAATNAVGNSLVQNAHVLGKVYFPRLLLPLTAAAAPTVDFILAVLVLLGLMAWFGVAITPALLLIPLVVVSVLVAVAGVGLIAASANVWFRDARHALPLMVQVWFFLTPVIYPIDWLSPRWAWLMQLNPMAGPVQAMRALVLGTPIDSHALMLSTAVSGVLMVTGLTLFHAAERRFADVV
jgi:lipopolysaccharide transport system permease protein